MHTKFVVIFFCSSALFLTYFDFSPLPFCFLCVEGDAPCCLFVCLFGFSFLTTKKNKHKIHLIVENVISRLALLVLTNYALWLYPERSLIKMVLRGAWWVCALSCVLVAALPAALVDRDDLKPSSLVQIEKVARSML